MRVFKSIRNTSLKQAARNIACKTSLYDWTLNSQDIPERLFIKPIDAWKGDVEKGRLICQGRFQYIGGTFSLYGENFSPADADPVALKYVHGFEWLRDLRTLGGHMARAQAIELTRSWIRQYERWHAIAWEPETLAIRLTMWFSHFDILSNSIDDEEFRDHFFAMLMRQSRHLYRSYKTGDYEDLPVLHILKGMLYAGLSLGQADWVTESLSALSAQLDRQIHYDGGHISRSLDTLLSILHILLDVRITLNVAGMEIPETIQQAIHNITPAVKFFRYQDKQFALFSGYQKGDPDFIDALIAQAGVRVKALKSLPITGYEKIIHGRGTIIMDTGGDKTLHNAHSSSLRSSSLAFEFTYGKERLITNCGSHPICPDWQYALSQTPAYSTATLGNKSAFSTTTSSNRSDDKHATIIEASHDGYEQSYGLMHTRRLYLCDYRQDFRGEDSFTRRQDVEKQCIKPVDFAIRFHLHPDVQVSLIQNGNAALLKLRHGRGGWRFTKSTCHLAVEDSVYLGCGMAPRKTKQLVIHGQIELSDFHIQWALRKEG